MTAEEGKEDEAYAASYPTRIHRFRTPSPPPF